MIPLVLFQKQWTNFLQYWNIVGPIRSFSAQALEMLCVSSEFVCDYHVLSMPLNREFN